MWSLQTPLCNNMPGEGGCGGAQTQWRGNDGQNVNIMGDFWMYPEVRFRPPLAGDEENPEFSTCTLPFVYYKSHEDNFWHTMISILPQVVGLLLEGKANRDITYVVSSPL